MILTTDKQYHYTRLCDSVAANVMILECFESGIIALYCVIVTAAKQCHHVRSNLTSGMILMRKISIMISMNMISR